MSKKENPVEDAPAIEEASVQRFGVFDADGRPVGFYSSDVHDQIPEGAIEITDEQWMDMIENPGLRVFQDGTLYEAEPLKIAKTMDFIRSRRDLLLSKSDWTQLADSPLSDSKKAEWAEYRQALRDLSTGNPETIEFPKKPA